MDSLNTIVSNPFFQVDCDVCGFLLHSKVYLKLHLVRPCSAGMIQTGNVEQVPLISSPQNLELQGACYIWETAVS